MSRSLSTIQVLFPIIFAVLILRSFLFEPFQIPTGSMIPTLNVGDFIVVNKNAYGVRLPVSGTKIMDVGEPKRGMSWCLYHRMIPTTTSKEVIGLPGDHIRYANKTIYVNGEPLEQEYVDFINTRRPPVVYSLETVETSHMISTHRPRQLIKTRVLAVARGQGYTRGHYFMMGDNRIIAATAGYGVPVSENKIVGKAVAVWMHKDPGLKLPTFSQNRLIKNP